jgi:hypothetical protein
MRPAHILRAAALLAPLLLAACQHPPVTLSPAYTPPVPYRDRLAETPADGTACRVFIGDVRDLRPDPQSMGSISLRTVHAGDSAGWVRSGLQTLDRDKRLRIAGTAADADLVLDAEILKAYIMSITTQKAANVVIRVRYSRHGVAEGDAIYRGALNEVNWIGGDDETQGAFDDALSQVIAAVAADTAKRCKP